MTPEQIRQWRRDYVVQGPCANCGGLAHDIHEILAGPFRKRAMAESACLLRLCRTCHDEVQGADVEYQLALKLLSDPEGFSISSLCRVWGRPRTAIDDEMVLIYIRMILMDQNGY